ncbi:MAG: hypothetical protein ABSE46_09650 [Terracidiphilus sp.]|jgi:hypothetical protein
MELVNRYLQAVKFWLPAKQKDDIAAEISADLQAQIEDRESVLDRHLTQTEIEEILKRRGRPCLVASSFRPQESLIGPVLYPIYLFSLKVALLFYLVPWLIVSLILLIVRPSFSAVQGIPAWFNILAQISGHLWTMSFVAAGTVTLIFAILERVQTKSHWLENWDPRKLPPVRNPNLNTRTNAAFELAILILAVAWWAAYMDRTVISFGESLHIALKPQWIWFFWCYLLELVISAATAAYSLLRPSFNWLQAALRVLNSLFGSVLFCLLLRTGIVAGMNGPSLTAQKATEITNAINQWSVTVFPLGMVLVVIIVAIEVTKIVLAARRRSQPV